MHLWATLRRSGLSFGLLGFPSMDPSTLRSIIEGLQLSDTCPKQAMSCMSRLPVTERFQAHNVGILSGTKDPMTLLAGAKVPC